MNTNTAYYSSIGRIKKILLIPSVAFRTINGLSIEKSVMLSFKKMEESFNSISSKPLIKFVIFYRCQNNSTSVHANEVNENRFHLVPIKPPGAISQYLDTKWAQDVIDINRKDYRYVEKLNTYYRNLITQKCSLHTPLPQISGFEGGGNIIRGKSGGKDFLIIGQQKKVFDIQQLATVFDVEVARICVLSIPEVNHNSPLFYHLDMFMCLLGDVDNTGVQKILIANPDGDDPDPLDGVVASVIRFLNNWICQNNLSDIQFDFIPIATRLINDTSGRLANAITYLNAQVENYTENGQKVVNIYMPQFEYTNSQKAQVFEQITTEINEEKDTGPGIVDGNTRLQAFNKAIFIDKVAMEKALAQIPNLKAHYIMYNFNALVDNLGSLHCLTKVVERDLVD